MTKDLVFFTFVTCQPLTAYVELSCKSERDTCWRELVCNTPEYYS
jgi:hypothetical protein